MTQVNRAFQRNITKSLRSLQNLTESGIYHYTDGDNLNRHYLMIFGHKDSPYSFVPYFFQVDLPDSYPFDNPKCKFICPANIRLHPNLYVNGKVCLSILNTWSGPKWTPIMDLSTLALNLQSLISCDEPLRCEPSFETGSNSSVLNYSNYIKLVNFCIVLPKVYRKCPIDNRTVQTYFQTEVDKYLHNHRDAMVEHGINLRREFKENSMTIGTIYNKTVTIRDKDFQKSLEFILGTTCPP